MEGFHFAKHLPTAALKDTTFLGLVNLLLECPYEKHLPWPELSQDMRESFGDDWKAIVSNWNQLKTSVLPTPETLPQLA